ncbi:interferon regulatory factor 4-like isoform X1 [Clupea harengus]|uniref:Interferon regulatory factor 4-like isoform X1 n=1 Tax=Clupea harengus TaxID=7950 RepID=A0A6P8FWR6_CLUHA|nr:interferon regulatory factor 4-like isoform X1 [Clupea harengus]
MNIDGERMSSGNGKLRQWLIDQVDTGKYPGLVWENDEKSIFRIPWKHAGKQDYNRDEDAALFKGWALFKGKFREGIDKPDPPTWKTRLRCALNKSTDFEEIVGRSQLDISDPYKVYRIIPEDAKKGSRPLAEAAGHLASPHYPLHSAYTPPQNQVCNYLPTPEYAWRGYQCDEPSHPDYSNTPYSPTHVAWENGYQFSGSFFSCSPSEVPPSPFGFPQPGFRTAEGISDQRLVVCVFYGGTLVSEVTVLRPEGCILTPLSNGHAFQPTVGPEVVPLPQKAGLESGVHLWVGAAGLYARSIGSGKVFWEGGHAPYTDKPNKLERDQTSKLMDSHTLLTELQGFPLHSHPLPRLQVLLSFGDDIDAEIPKRTLTVQVEPLFARQLIFLSQSGGNYIRSHDFHTHTQAHSLSHTENEPSPPNSQDYARVITHLHGNAFSE